MPTVRQIVDGLVWWIVIQTEFRMRQVKFKNQIRNSKQSAQNSMEKFLNKICIPKSKWDTPLELISDQPDLKLINPYSAVACWVLYLYSMELGSPPLYMELNRATREMDKTKLPQLGPFAVALAWVCERAE